MSEIRGVETQCCASPINCLTRVAVLLQGPDGWRCYESFHVLNAGDMWEDNKARAVEWTRLHGNKLPPEQAKRYFLITPDMKFAP